jgi:hypothetical protein
MPRRTPKEQAAAHIAALRIIEERDCEETEETIRWRALYERCKRVALEAEELENEFRGTRRLGGIRECRISEDED